MQKYPLILCSSYEIMSLTDQQKLRDYQKSGGRLVLGPVLPAFDEKLEQLCLLQDAEVLYSPQDWNPEASGLKAEFRADEEGIELCRHRLGKERILFAANLQEKERKVTIRFSGEGTFSEISSGNILKGRETVRVSMRGYSVTAWRVEVTG